jgi:hypothetical protein
VRHKHGQEGPDTLTAFLDRGASDNPTASVINTEATVIPQAINV